jgi:ABC-type multidrug transport system fused ATPase/permease subunit
MFESIKAERHMSFGHWRYRLLHWCFKENAKTPKESDLPAFLYTHYCPLFHLTNLIAILFPFVLLVKIIIGLVRAAAAGFALIPWEAIGRFIGKCIPDASEESLKAQKVKEEKGLILRKIAAGGYTGFADFWIDWKYFFTEMQKEEVQTYFEAVAAAVQAARTRAAERKKKLREQLIFWSNFSSTFLKWFFNIAYLGAGALVIWLLYLGTWPVLCFCWDTIVFLCTFNPIPFLLWVGKVFVIVGVCFVVVYGFYRFGMLRRGAAAAGWACAGALPPIFLVGDLVCMPFKWTFKAISAFFDFAAVFYEENCPPIKIVSVEEESIETAAEEAHT